MSSELRDKIAKATTLAVFKVAVHIGAETNAEAIIAAALDKYASALQAQIEALTESVEDAVLDARASEDFQDSQAEEA